MKRRNDYGILQLTLQERKLKISLIEYLIIGAHNDSSKVHRCFQ